ncbi:hypothetical protein [Amycolatopsis sp. cg9]|uniref:hypothetical protein n=1 Tax=Amycolatopsis sp. cg9 TaxID=3238801 RepID=UPI0035240D5F
MCAEGGDSSGPLFTRDGSANGSTSAAAATAAPAGVTFFQPVTTALLAVGTQIGG